MKLLGRVVRIGRQFNKWPVALVLVVVFAALLLVPGLGSVGIWEPQERQLVDRVAPRDEIAKKRAEDEAKQKAAAKAAPANPTACIKSQPDDALARTLQAKAPAWGRDTFGDSDAGRRLPAILMGILTVLAVFGTATRVTRSPRAGLIAALVALSFPLLVLQTKMLTSEIGTACGASLIVYGLTSLSLARATAREILAAIVALLALALGLLLGFMGGGALHGLIVPIGAVAAASSLGAPAIRWLGGTIVRGVRGFLALAIPRWKVGRRFEARPIEQPAAEIVVGALATIAAIVLLGVLASSIFELRPPYPGQVPTGRSIFGKVVAAPACWSDVLGGIWKADDDLRSIFDSSFEQIAYGTFPWGILAPIAMIALLRAERREHQKLGALALAWAGAAWIADEVWSRKVGFSIWAGFPALAIAIGGWLDHAIAERSLDHAIAERSLDHAIAERSLDETGEGRESSRAPTLLIGLFVGLAILDLGKDLQSFTERLVSLLVGSDAIPYPTAARLAWIPTRVWILVLGVLLALAFAVAMIAQGRKLALRAAAVALAFTVVVAGFWSFGWYPSLATNLSSKTMFDEWQALRAKGDELVVMGDLGDAPFDYGGPDYTKVDTRDQVVKSLAKPTRVFAIAPQTELCTLHREIGGKPYFVLDDRNTRSVLISNKVDGAEDVNPLRETILHAPPPNIPAKPKARVAWDNKIELMGWDIPAKVARGSKFEVTMYYKILGPVGAAWTSLMHFDGPTRFNGDHKPINDRCPTSTWQAGDYIVDTFTVTAGGATFPKVGYELWIGFFTGTNPNFKNMAVSEAPQDLRDQNDRVKIMTVVLD